MNKSSKCREYKRRRAAGVAPKSIKIIRTADFASTPPPSLLPLPHRHLLETLGIRGKDKHGGHNTSLISLFMPPSLKSCFTQKMCPYLEDGLPTAWHSAPTHLTHSNVSI